MRSNREYGFAVPPSIGSLELPPLRSRFPWRVAGLQTIVVLLDAKVADLAPHTSECLLFPMADRTGDILLHCLTGDEASAYVHAAGRHLLDRGYPILRLSVRSAGPSRPY